MKNLVLLLTLLIPVFTFSQIINIPADYPTIQQGIDAANIGDIVLVDTGTYVENINFIGKDIIVASNYLITLDTSYISNTIIDGSDGGSVVIFENEESHDAILNGFTISNGNSSSSGGGINCVYFSNPSLENLIIKENYAKYNGGGIICGAGANPALKNVLITNNEAGGSGGGIFCFNFCNPTLENVVISNNSADNGGGIILLEASAANLKNVTLSNNTAKKGGGIYCGNSNPTLQDVVIRGNTTVNKGGGVAIYDSNPTLVNVQIEDNFSWMGGGIYCENSNPTMTNVCIANNEAAIETGGIGGGIALENAEPSIVNLTLVDNTAGSIGGGIYLTTNSQLNLINSILWNNNPKEVYFDLDNEANSITISYCDIQGGQDSISTNHNGEVHWLEGNIDQDPLFVNSGNHPCQINDNSPCINAGTSDTTGLNLPEYDLAGEVRVFNERVDIGAYEWNTFVEVEEFEIQGPKFTVRSYPNPFTTTTTIEYELNQPETVTITFYNQFGIQVDRIEQKQTVGKQQVTWVPDLPGGLYLFKMVAGKKHAAGRAILMR